MRRQMASVMESSREPNVQENSLKTLPVRERQRHPFSQSTPWSSALHDSICKISGSHLQN